MAAICSAKLGFRQVAYYVPTEHIHRKGHDRFRASKSFLAISDGVGSTENSMVDPGLYAEELLSLLKRYFDENREKYTGNLVELISRAVRDNRKLGSATCLVAVLDHRNSLVNVANIGDSSFLHLRKLNNVYQVLNRGTTTQYSFNFPLQVSATQNTCEKAVVKSIPVQKGDLFITATDGLFDNLSEESILALVNSSKDKTTFEFAKSLTHFALAASLDPYHYSPFVRELQRNHVLNRFIGGKPDDITVVVSAVEESGKD